MTVYIVQGWDEGPRAVFATAEGAIAFSKQQRDYEERPLREDDLPEYEQHYPFIYACEVRT